MNNRIRQLAKEHFCRTEYDNGNIHECYEFSERELKEFAELIVKEFIGQNKSYLVNCSNRDFYDGWNMAIIHCNESAKEFFGVEE